MITPVLYRDRDVAKLLGMSSSWVRGQRHLRRQGKEHVFSLDPVLIGSTPLYPVDELLSWVEERRRR